MVNIIKAPIGNSPGVLVFTHKERPILEANIPAVRRALTELSRKYVIGMHWGWHAEDVGPIPFVQFHLGAEGTLKLRDDNPTPVIRLCSRNFLSDDFHPSAAPKTWDVLFAGRAIAWKGLDTFLETLRPLFDIRPGTRALLFAPIRPEDMKIRRHVEATVNRLFTPAEKENIDIVLPLQLDIDKYFSVSQTTMASLFRLARVFMHASKVEGNARVIQEALLCGVPCVVRRDLAGGGKDYLNAVNARLYDSPEEAARQIASLLDSPPDMQPEADRLSKILRAGESKKSLTAALADVFARAGLPFAGDLEPGNYALILPSHTQALPRAWRLGPQTDDLNSAAALLRYAGMVLGHEPAASELLLAQSAWHTVQAARFAKLVPGALLRRVQRLALRRKTPSANRKH